MPLAKCPRTGKLFDNTKGLVHPDAVQTEEDDYSRISDYLSEHPNAQADEIVNELEVTHDCIKRMIKSGRVKEFDKAALEAQAQEHAEREQEINKRNMKMSRDLGAVLSSRPKNTQPEVGRTSMHNRKLRDE